MKVDTSAAGARGGGRSRAPRPAPGGRHGQAGAESPGAGDHRFRRPRRPRDTRARPGGQLQRARGGEGQPAVREAPGGLLRPRGRHRGVADDLQPRGPQGHHARRGDPRLRRCPPTARRCWCARAGSYNLYDANPKGASSKKTVSTAGLQADIVPQQEWAQIFNEVWRRFRDFFYVPEHERLRLEGAARQVRAAAPVRRPPLRPRLRAPGDDLGAEQLAHLHLGRATTRSRTGRRSRCPGARFALDPASGRYRIASIFRGDNAEAQYRSPLTDVGVDAHVGDYVMAIDGEELKAPDNPYRLLRYKADHPVTLTLNTRPVADGARQVTYRPITSETELVYYNWVTDNWHRVDSMTNGRVGYLHLPDMGSDGINEFIKWYYPQIRKEGLVDRRARQRRRQHLRHGDRAPQPQAPGDRVLAQQRVHDDVSRRADLLRLAGGAAQRDVRVRRRHLPGDVQAGGARAADRQAVVGRGHRHHRATAR